MESRGEIIVIKEKYFSWKRREKSNMSAVKFILLSSYPCQKTIFLFLHEYTRIKLKNVAIWKLCCIAPTTKNYLQDVKLHFSLQFGKMLITCILPIIFIRFFFISRNFNIQCSTLKFCRLCFQSWSSLLILTGFALHWHLGQRFWWGWFEVLFVLCMIYDFFETLYITPNNFGPKPLLTGCALNNL